MGQMVSGVVQASISMQLTTSHIDVIYTYMDIAKTRKINLFLALCLALLRPTQGNSSGWKYCHA
jgi:hypothetical protein